MPEVAARIAGLVAGDYDIAVEIPPDQWEGLKAYPDISLKTVPLENSHIIVFNTNDPVLSDKKLRHALSLAIDRKALIDALWKSQTYTPNGYQLPSFGPLYDKNRNAYGYDPRKRGNSSRKADTRARRSPTVSSPTTTSTTWRQRKSYRRCGALSA